MTTLTAPPSIGQSEVKRLLARWAGVGDVSGSDAGVRDRVLAEYVRHHLCHLGPRRVHVLRLRAAILRQLGMLQDWFDADNGPTWTDFEPDYDGQQIDLGESFLGTLELLSFLKEAVHAGGGYYLPVPTRIVFLSSGAAVLVSGLPTHALAQSLGIKVSVAGMGRVATVENTARLSPSIPRQSLATWLGRPAENLADWTERLMRDARSRLSASGSGIPFEVYDPLSSDIHTRRWVRSSTWAKGNRQVNDLYLCRTLRRPRLFWLAPLERGHQDVWFDRLSEVAPEHARLLMYGIDQIAKRPVRARVLRVPGTTDAIEIRLWSWPSWQELRLLLALGHRLTIYRPGSRDVQHLPICFHLSEQWWPDVHQGLIGLGITIVDERPRS